MPKLLITAFKPYDQWQANASWLALVELMREIAPSQLITTRLYPVDFAAAREQLAKDLKDNYDFAIHLGQAPGSSRLRLETTAINIAVDGGANDDFRPVVAEGPAAYRAEFPFGDWARQLRAAGIPASVSFHAGTYLCNGVFYLSHYLAETLALKTRSLFIHVPLDVTQTVYLAADTPALPAAITARGLRIVVDELNRV